MKVNNKILSIPPYISTSWNYVDGIYMKGATLVINLFGGESVNIPGLKSEVIQMIFAAHAEALEQDAIQQTGQKIDMSQMMGLPFGFPPASEVSEGGFHLGISPMGAFGSAMQHNPAQANAPEIPREILEKISAIMKIMSPEDTEESDVVAGCNCPHCQIARAVTGVYEDDGFAAFANEEVAKEAEASSSPMSIEKSGENLYNVKENSTSNEFKVFLGNPFGCTCGKEGCEHLHAVLRSYD